MRCPDPGELLAFRDGRVDAASHASIEAHVRDCARCARSVTCSHTAPTRPDRVGAPSTIPKPGDTVGRYVILRLLGAGGMGAVCLAYDPDLDRRVALKFLLPNVRHGQHRLLREAQAMAKLPHPNIVPIHDVGTHDDVVFIAMEHVDGVTVAEWLKERRRSLREVLDVFLAAGRGLAAAHAAGFVHRDFKPSNLLLGKDGRVLVTDFGLVRSSGAAIDAVSDAGDNARAESAEGAGVASAERGRLTATGAILGTPHYMAPEQLVQDGVVDPRTDQFSFCVSLHEALYGELPFRESADGTRVPCEPAERRRMPTWIRRILARGMATEPEARFPSMNELLAALERDPTIARRRWVGAAALLGVAAAVALGTRALVLHGRALCTGAGDAIESSWNETRAAALRSAFGSTHAPFAARASEDVIALLDGYARRWSAMARDACEATRVQGGQSEELLDLRMQCLSQQRQELASVVDRLVSPDAETAARASKIAQSLSAIDDCADARLLKEPIRPPADANVRARVQALRGELARARGIDDAARFSEALPVMERIATEADAIGYLPLQAEARYELGRVQDHAGDSAAAAATLRKAFLAAEQGRHDRVATDSAIALVRAVADSVRLDAAREWADNASAWCKRIGCDEATESRLQHNLGGLQFRLGRYAEALTSFKEALRLRERVYEPGHADTLETLGEIANALEAQGRRDEAAQVGRRVVSATEKALGPDHPAVAIALVNLGAAIGNEGHFSEALDIYRRALAVFERALPADHPFTAGCLLDLAEALVGLGRIDEGIASAERALAMQRRLHGSSHPDVAVALGALGEMRGMRGAWEAAHAAEEEALSIQEKALGTGHPDLADTLIALARAEMKLHDRRRARRHLERALSLPVSDPRVRDEAKKLVRQL